MSGLVDRLRFHDATEQPHHLHTEAADRIVALEKERDSLREQLRAAEGRIARTEQVFQCSIDARDDLCKKAENRADKLEAALAEANRQRDEAVGEAFNLNGALINAEERIRELEASQSHGTFAEGLESAAQYFISKGASLNGMTYAAIAEEIRAIQPPATGQKEEKG